MNSAPGLPPESALPGSAAGGGVFSGLFAAGRRLYVLGWLDGEGPELAVEAWWGREELSGGFEYRVDCLSADALLDLKGFLGRAASLWTRLSDGLPHPRAGHVRAAEALGSDGGLARYRLTLVPWPWLLSRGRHNRVFQDKSVAEIAEAVFSDYRDVAAWRWSDESSGFLAGARRRGYCVQYEESDYAFVSRILAEEGIGWRAEADEAAPGGHRAVFFADSRLLPEDRLSASPLGGRGIRLHPAGAQEEQDAVLAFGEHLRLDIRGVAHLGYDYESRRVRAAAVPGRAAAGESAPRLEDFDDAGAGAFADAAEAERYGRLRLEGAEARAASCIGRGTIRSLSAGTRVEIVGLARSAGAGEEAGDPPGHLVTGLVQVGINNLSAPGRASLLARLARRQAWSGGGEDEAIRPVSAPAQPPPDLLKLAGEYGYACQFSAQRAARPWRPLLEDGTGGRMNPRATAPGPMTATVVGPGGQRAPSGADEIWRDALGRVKVRFHWQRGEAAEDRDSCWLRVAQRQAGAGMGWQWLPRIGQEVLVGFLGGDIDRPVVLGALYNGRGEGGVPATPGGRVGESDTSVFELAADRRPGGQGNLAGGHAPSWHGGAGEPHRHPGALSGFKSKEFGGAGHSRLALDDSDGQQRAHLAATAHASELSLGHLIEQCGNYRGSFRGAGAELRTDAWGALRGGRGLLVSGWPHASPGSPSGEFSPGLSLSGQACELAEALSAQARAHEGVQLGAALGTSGAGQSVPGPGASPLRALRATLSGMGDAKDAARALSDAEAQVTAAGPGRLPQLSAPALALASRDDLAQAAGQGLQLAAGEAVVLSSGGDTNFAVVGKARAHAGQAIGLLSGAFGAGEDGRGLALIAGRGDIEIQAQSGPMEFRARDRVRLASSAGSIDLAAAKKVRLAVEGGASLAIEGGNITVQCPGTITVHASMKSFSGPDRENYPLPRFPDNPFENNPPHFDFKLTDMPGPDGMPLGDTPWRIVLADDAHEALARTESLLSGRSDAEGKIALTPTQEAQLGQACLSGQKVWALFEGQAKQLEATRERESWTDQQKLEHALDALGFADSFGLAAESDSNGFAAPLARDELGRPISTIYDKFKKGV